MDHAISLLETHSYNEVAALTGISKSTLIREVKRRKVSNDTVPSGQKTEAEAIESGLERARPMKIEGLVIR